jgi:3-deoxy-D-manno-octulosonate 8-phosphate phosphatase (KDO 8-P phosphatase)
MSTNRSKIAMPAHFPAELYQAAGRIQLLLSDVDGCWTDGTITFDRDGSESVTFYAHDGYGVKQAQLAGIEVVVISGRNNPAVVARAKQLGVKEIHVGIADKTELARQLVEARGFSPSQVAALGDDLPDHPLFDAAALTFAPPQATAAILQRADHVTQADAGRGAVREVCDILVAARGDFSPRAGTQ